MKWKHHSILAASVASLLGMNLAEVIYCACFANLPDQMESVGPFRLFRHRTWTHDIGLWGGACACIFVLAILHAVPDRFVVRTWTIPLPGVMHLLGDMVTPCGIRFLGTKMGFPLFKTGSSAEWLFVVVVGVSALVAVAYTHSW
jgi:membrane-bound metal-dependent hydrolase YbcI (DUF457 family)